jgi:hypothetical protein
VGSIKSAGLSGWRPNLAFPLIRDEAWSASDNLALLGAFVGLIAGAAVLAYLRWRDDGASAGVLRRKHWLTSASVLALLIALSSVATSARGHWVRPDYLLDQETTWRNAASALLDQERCRICFTSRRRAIDWKGLEPNSARRMHVDTVIDRLTLTLRVVLEGANGPGFARMRVEFGDRTATPWTGVVGDRAVSHTYRNPGEHELVVWVQLRDGTVRHERQMVRVGASP